MRVPDGILPTCFHDQNWFISVLKVRMLVFFLFNKGQQCYHVCIFLKISLTKITTDVKKNVCPFVCFSQIPLQNAKKVGRTTLRRHGDQWQVAWGHDRIWHFATQTRSVSTGQMC